jgi:hypothetical protein
MPRMMFILALLGLLVSDRPVLAGPPEQASGRMVLDEVPTLRDRVRRLERELAKTDPTQAEDLAEARAGLAEAKGLMGTAAAEWRKVVASRRAKMADLERLLKAGRLCFPGELVLQRGRVAEARCKVAEVEGDRVALAAELPQAIAYYEAYLERLRRLMEVGAISSDEAKKEERGLRRELDKARSQLRATSAGLQPARSAAEARPSIIA